MKHLGMSQNHGELGELAVEIYGGFPPKPWHIGFDLHQCLGCTLKVLKLYPVIQQFPMEKHHVSSASHHLQCQPRINKP